MHFALISYLNARPLWWGLVHAPRQDETFEFSSPARCADLIRSGQADLGLIPAIELQRIPDLVAIPRICIASRTEVRSVLLFSRVPFEQIRSVSLDPSSRTSVALARVLLGEKLGRDVYAMIDFVDRGTGDAGLDCDAEVMIGDPALQMAKSPGAMQMYCYDLVSEWYALFGEPFVFAVWAGREDRLRERDPEALIRRLTESLAAGEGAIRTIAEEAALELDLPVGELHEYFRDALHYELGGSERRALARFHALAADYGLTQRSEEIRWITDRQ